MSEFTATYGECCCARCGIQYFIPQQFKDRRREDHQEFFCPNGHSNYFPQETKEERLKRLLEREEENHRITRVDLIAVKRQRDKAQRKLKRVGVGVCPECNRSFQNVRRHMETKHGKKRRK